MPAPKTARPGVNARVADALREMAHLLEQQANPFRVGAYRRAAETVAGLQDDLRRVDAAGGVEALTRLPDVGRGIATAIHELLVTGRLGRLQRLRGEMDAERLFRTVPGLGPELARRIHEALGIDSLEALELAAHDGRLEQVRGIGPRRAAALRATLDSMLGRRVRRAAWPAAGEGPDVATILEVDREYREQAAAGRLPTIASRRFNPGGEAWLPVLHTQRDDWHFTALFSNTARAHELQRTRDWVVTYFYDGDHHEGQYTVVTESRGPLAGRRVVRGREADCRAHYAAQAP